MKILVVSGIRNTSTTATDRGTSFKAGVVPWVLPEAAPKRLS